MKNIKHVMGMGALESAKDYRTIPHPTMAWIMPPTGGIHYDTTKDLDNQRHVGICTDISVVQNANKVTGKKYSPDFGYLIQKKFIDGNWTEGSSIFNSLKAKVKYGFLPSEFWTYTTEADRDLPYDQYIAKLQAVSDSEIARLLLLCEKPLLGYTQVDVSSIENITQAIISSAAGILCRYSTGAEWYSKPDGTYSWKPEDIDPITPFGDRTSGHAINASFYDVTTNPIIEHPNTWGGAPTPERPVVWDRNGICTIDWNKYKMTEAWVPHYTPTPLIIHPDLPAHQPLTKNLGFGMKNDDIKRVQHVLNVLPETGFFGLMTLSAVIRYQRANNITPTGFVGPITRASLNAKFF